MKTTPKTGYQLKKNSWISSPSANSLEVRAQTTRKTFVQIFPQSAKDAAIDGPPSAPELKAQIEAEREGRPFLVFRNGADEQAIVAIEAGADELWVGRSESADVRLEWDEEVSACTPRSRSCATSAPWSTTASPATAPSSTRSASTAAATCATATPCASAAPRSSSGARGRAPSAEETVIASETPAAASISPAQRRVLLALCRPYKDGANFATPATNQEIGAELHLSVDAVKTHMRALFEKLGVGDLPQNQKRVALVERALQTGVVSATASSGRAAPAPGARSHFGPYPGTIERSWLPWGWPGSPLGSWERADPGRI